MTSSSAPSPTGRWSGFETSGARVLGSQSYDFVGRLNGSPTAFMLLFLRPGANALGVRQAIEHRLNELATSFPRGISYKIPFDTTPFVTASIEEVVVTLLEAMVLVALVVFLFLQSWRATLIPMLAVPVSVIGTFLGLLLIGFSINVLTLFALVLAIGIVVDDAIVVIENVERIMASEKVSARVAADRAIRQVAGALVAIVLSLVAVFVPVGFTGGVTGGMFKQFAITIVIAVVLSGIVALTLTPALCAFLLKESVVTHTGGFFGKFNRWFARVTGGYAGAVDRVLGRPRAWLGAFGVVIVLAVVLWRHVPRAFIPTEDKGYFAIAVQLPDGASLQRTTAIVERVEGFLRQEPAVRNIVALAGFDILSRASQPNSATIFVNAKPWDERDAKSSIDAITGRLNGRLFGMRDAIAFALQSAGDHRVGRDSRGGSEHPEPLRPERSGLRRQGTDVCSGGESAPCGAGRSSQLPRQRAAVVRGRRPRDRQGTRCEAHRAVRYASGAPVHPLHQRLQPVRPDLSGAARSAGRRSA